MSDLCGQHIKTKRLRGIVHFRENPGRSFAARRACQISVVILISQVLTKPIEQTTLSRAKVATERVVSYRMLGCTDLRTKKFDPPPVLKQEMGVKNPFKKFENSRVFRKSIVLKCSFVHCVLVYYGSEYGSNRF